MTEILKEKKLILDAETNILELLQHSFVNFLYGLFSGLVIMAMIMANPLFIFVTYYLLKQIESKILNRNKYTTKLGKHYIFPIPSTLGFLLAYYISELLK